MGSSGNNQNPWSPYETYKDCSQGICSIYCPQWCYIIFPPPPPSSFYDDDGAGTDFSPLVIAVIGILASAFILVTYYTIVSRYCRRRNRSSAAGGTELDDQAHRESFPSSGGLDEVLIKSITVCKYKKNDGFVDGTDCSVCLSEFEEDETLRLLPKCNHAFHAPCIDAWLKNQASCPLCRSNIAAAGAAPSSAAAAPVNVSIASLQHNRSDDTVLVIRDLERVVVREVIDEREREREDYDENRAGGRPSLMRRSLSLDSVSRPVRISDILQASDGEDHDDDDGGEEEEDFQVENILEIGSSENSNYDKSGNGTILNLVRNNPVAMKRSTSTGRFMFSRYGKGRSSIVQIHP